MSKSKTELKAFSVGDRVSWKSQAGGSETKKIGTVVEVVPAGKQPTKVSSTSTRKHESYVVEVTFPSYRSAPPIRKLVQPAPQLYWPLVKNLRLVKYGGVDPKAARPRPTGSTDPVPPVETAKAPSDPELGDYLEQHPGARVEVVEERDQATDEADERIAAANIGIERAKESDLSGSFAGDVN